MIDVFSLFPILPLPPTEKEIGKVACIGSGITSLSCAIALRQMGFEVTIYEALPKAGGLMTFGIPEHHLPQHQVDELIDKVIKSGVKIQTNSPFNKDLNLRKLTKSGYLAVFLGIGLWGRKKSKFDQIKADGLMDAISFLTLTKTGLLKLKETDNIAIIGDNISAAYCAETASLQHSGTFILTKKSYADLKSDDISFDNALTHGATAFYNTEIKKICTENGEIKSVRAIGATIDTTIKVNYVITAFDQIFEKPNAGCALMLKAQDLLSVTDFMTAKAGVFAGGNVIRGNADLAQCVSDGINAAKKIHSFIIEKNTLSI